MNLRSARATGLALLAAVLVSPVTVAQEPATLQQKLAAAQQAAAKNQQALRAYTWISTTQLSVNGDVKNTKVESCRYGSDGSLQKTEVTATPPPDQKPGLRGMIQAKKIGEMEDQLEAAAALVKGYVPPDPNLMQAVIGNGKASVAQQGTGSVALTFPSYRQAGDALTLTFNTTVQTMSAMSVATWLNEPSTVVTLNAQMDFLSDASYPRVVTMLIPSSQIQVQITNSNYQKVMQ